MLIKLFLKILGLPLITYELMIVALVMILFFISIIEKAGRYHVKYFLFFILASLSFVFSYILNPHNLNDALLFYTNILIQYLLFISLINLSLNQQDYKKIVKLIFFLIYLQIFASIIKFFTIGPSELFIGTISGTAGALSTIFPIFCLSYMFSFYYLNKKKSI